ncbi:MAG: LPS export ABC transporter periplasmic protein LptC [Rhodobacteraceae bacterium]|nr:LPS export ABC transporter periplasmic protein LptC [Paracoccaceae bacterium]
MGVDRYSRIINFLKLALPFAALVILSTLFLLSRERNASDAVPFAASELRDRVANQQVTGPVFSGLSTSGDAMTVTADAMRSTSKNDHEARKIDAAFDMANGTRISVVADDGQISVLSQTATLNGHVRLTTSGGIEFQSDQVDAQLEPLSIASPGPIKGTTPFGTLSAGGMRLSDLDERGQRQLLFTNGVKLVYQPKSTGE